MVKYNQQEKNPQWKGNDAGYIAIHTWVRKWKGKHIKCEICGVTTCKKFEWANIDHTYRRVLEDYISMCCSCHKKYDYKNNLKPNSKLGNNQFTKK